MPGATPEVVPVASTFGFGVKPLSGSGEFPMWVVVPCLTQLIEDCVPPVACVLASTVMSVSGVSVKAAVTSPADAQSVLATTVAEAYRQGLVQPDFAARDLLVLPA